MTRTSTWEAIRTFPLRTPDLIWLVLWARVVNVQNLPVAGFHCAAGSLMAGSGPIRVVPTANSSIQSFCACGKRPEKQRCQEPFRQNCEETVPATFRFPSDTFRFPSDRWDTKILIQFHPRQWLSLQRTMPRQKISRHLRLPNPQRGIKSD